MGFELPPSNYDYEQHPTLDSVYKPGDHPECDGYVICLVNETGY